MTTSLRTLRSRNAVNRDEMVPCPFCDKDIDKAWLARHLATHTDTRPFRCPYCDKGFPKQHKLNRHLTTHSEVRPMIHCTLCSKSYISDCGFKEHMIKVHGCRKRSRESLNKSAAANVMNETAMVKIEQEQQQPAIEVKTEMQHEEMEIVPNHQTTLENTTTPMVTIYQNDLLGLENDTTAAGASKSESCPICNQCIGKYGLAYHMLIHRKSVMKPYRCLQCKIGFPKPSCLAKHIKRVHERNNNSEKVLNECAVCKKKYSSKSELELHNCETDIAAAENTSRQVATQEMSEQQLPTFKCHICENMYRTTTGLEFHKLRVHRNEIIKEQMMQMPSGAPPPAAPFKCDKCHKEVITKQSYHECIEGIAVKKKLFQCGICKKVYWTRKALDSHNAKLHGIIKVLDRKRPPIKCDGCHKEFKSRRYLRTQHVCRGVEKAQPVATTPTKSKFICIRYL